MWNPNGILVQGLNDRTNFVKNFPYTGMNAFYSFPLLDRKDPECRELTWQQQFSKTNGNLLVSELITDADFYQRYINKCAELQIPVRSLFIESSYSLEIWNDPLPDMELMGYEYCPMPVDEQIITDMDWYQGFSRFWPMLNAYGLFNTVEDVKGFVEAYNCAYLADEVGDGEADMYICRVSIVL